MLIEDASAGPVSTNKFTGVIASHTISATFAANSITGSSAVIACNSYTWIENNNTTYTNNGQAGIVK